MERQFVLLRISVYVLIATRFPNSYQEYMKGKLLSETIAGFTFFGKGIVLVVIIGSGTSQKERKKENDSFVLKNSV